MSKQGATGIRAAKGLLELLDENSAEDFEAAKSILGPPELVDILQLLTNYKKQEHEPDPKAKTVEDLAEVVRTELIGLGIPPREMARIAQESIDSAMSIPVPPTARLQDIVHRALEWIDTHVESPTDQVRTLIELVLRAARFAGPDHEEKVADSLRALTVEALAGNFVMFSDLKALGDLRLRWNKTPLTPVPKEPRRHLASRLLNDAQMNASESYRQILEDLLVDGLRSPTDTATILMRRMKLQKANPPPAANAPASNKKFVFAKPRSK